MNKTKKLSKKSITVDINSYPKTSTQWWNWLDTEWELIHEILKKLTKNKNAINQISDCKKYKDPKIKDLLEEIWNLVPENFERDKFIGWPVFSELMSEIDILDHDHHYFVHKSV